MSKARLLPVAAIAAVSLGAVALAPASEAQMFPLKQGQCKTFQVMGFGLTKTGAEAEARAQVANEARYYYAADSTRIVRVTCTQQLVVMACDARAQVCKK